jgi:hypothetical protein
LLTKVLAIEMQQVEGIDSIRNTNTGFSEVDSGWLAEQARSCATYCKAAGWWMQDKSNLS